MTSMDVFPLDLVGDGETAAVAHVTGSAPLGHRLRELGFVPGSRVRMVRSGSPCILVLNDSTRLSLRGTETESILVRRLR